MKSLIAFLIIGLIGCSGDTSSTHVTGTTPVPTTDTQTAVVDADNDGYNVDEDCDDEDASIHPGAEDIPQDGIDQDCDGEDAQFVTTDGPWALSNATIVNDGCGVSSLGDATEVLPLVMDILNSSVDGFDYTDESGGAHCVRTDLDFDCDQVTITSPIPDYDADLVMDLTMSGTIIDNDNMASAFDVSIVDCEGSDCYLVEFVITIPCDMNFTFDLTAE